MNILPSSSHVSTTVWLQHLDYNETLEKKLNGTYTKMLHTVLNKFWKLYPTKHQLYDHLPPISQTIKDRGARYAGYYLRSKDTLISNVLQ